jgi:phosphoribosyl 1,2-cyclic phosphate phosphodiesterase
MPIFANEIAWIDLRRIFQYVFKPVHFGGGLPQLIPHTVYPNAPFNVGPEITVTPLEVIHGKLPVIAYRFNDFAYATDLNFISDETIKALSDLDVLVLDCVRIRPHATHLGLNEALEYIERIKPRRAYLTHLNHDILHARDSKLLPDNVEFSYDGLVIED